MKYTYTFDQLRDNPAGISALFMDYEWAKANGGVDTDNYFTADSGTIDADTPQEACEKLYRIYNVDRPSDYHGRSMSVSDIINLWDNEPEPPVKTSWYCNRIGFVQIGEERTILDTVSEFSKVQRSGHFPCPRCGRYRMASDPIRNALSRHASVQVCDACGIDEAMRDFRGATLPLEEWAIARNPASFVRCV